MNPVAGPWKPGWRRYGVFIGFQHFKLLWFGSGNLIPCLHCEVARRSLQPQIAAPFFGDDYSKLRIQHAFMVLNHKS